MYHIVLCLVMERDIMRNLHLDRFQARVHAKVAHSSSLFSLSARIQYGADTNRRDHEGHEVLHANSRERRLDNPRSRATSQDCLS